MTPSAVPPPRIRIPRWVQLVGLPLLLVLAWVLATTAGHAVIVFLVASLVALLLDPIVRALGRLRIPRGIAVAFVFLTFLACLVFAILAIGTVVAGQARTAADRFNDYFTVADGRSGGGIPADRDVDRLQHWLDTHRLEAIEVQEPGHRLVRQVRERDVGRYANEIVDFVEGAAISIGRGVFSTILVVVISIYMLLDMPRLHRFVDRRLPPHGRGPLLISIERALASYVRGQALLSLIIGTSAGVGLYLLGVTGLLPGVERYALVMGIWVGLTEVLPYLGPWLGAIPAGLYALVVEPFAIVWVTALFLAIHQIEGHVVVPKVMGSALRLHPLLVIFGLLVGFEIHGLLGALISLPMLAAARATWEFFGDRLELETWEGGGAIPVEVEPVHTPPPEPQRPAAVDR